MEANAVAPAPSLWRRVWSVIQVVEMSSGEYQDLRIDALERRLVKLEKALQEREPGPPEAPRVSAREPS